MSTRRAGNRHQQADVSPEEPSALAQLFKQHASFEGAVGTLHDVSDALPHTSLPTDLSLNKLNPFKSRKKPDRPTLKTLPDGFEWVLKGVRYAGKPKRVEDAMSFDAFELNVELSVVPAEKYTSTMRTSAFVIQVHVYPGEEYAFMAQVTSKKSSYILSPGAIRFLITETAPYITGLYLKPNDDSDPVYQAVVDAIIEHSHVSSRKDSPGHNSAAALTKNNQLKFSEAISVGEDASDVSAVRRSLMTYTVGVTRSSSETDEEWKKDIDYILSMFVQRGFKGEIEVLKRTSTGPKLTDVKITIDQDKKQMSLTKGTETVKTFAFNLKVDMIKFLEDYVKSVMNAKLIDTIFRVYG